MIIPEPSYIIVECSGVFSSGKVNIRVYLVEIYHIVRSGWPQPHFDALRLKSLNYVIVRPGIHTGIELAHNSDDGFALLPRWNAIHNFDRVCECLGEVTRNQP